MHGSTNAVGAVDYSFYKGSDSETFIQSDGILIQSELNGTQIADLPEEVNGKNRLKA